MALDSEIQEPQLDDPTLWVDRYGDALLRFALSRVGQKKEVAEDLVQETLLAAWRGRDSFDSRASLSTWLFSILRRKVADHYRRAGREQALDHDEPVPGGAPMFDSRGHWLESIPEWQAAPNQLVENTEFWGVMASCLAGLPAHLAEAFQLREIRFASVDEVCTMTGITPKNLSVRLHRARLLLRSCLGQKWFGNDA
jgi:RNA polymerase sigma-70 factor (ECF subfamily)